MAQETNDPQVETQDGLDPSADALANADAAPDSPDAGAEALDATAIEAPSCAEGDEACEEALAQCPSLPEGDLACTTAITSCDSADAACLDTALTQSSARADAYAACPAPLEGAEEAASVEAVEGAEPVLSCAEQIAACALGDEACLSAATTPPAPIEEAAPAMISGVMNLIDVGGPVIMILIGLSLISLAIIVAKIAQFIAMNISAKRFIQQAADKLKVGDLEGALTFLQRKRGPVARVMEAAVRGKALGGDEETTREEVTRVAQNQLEGLEAGLPYLSLIATISPLLGLLGTVLGMIDAFQQLEGAGDRVDPAILSGGIWEALLTTAAGLSVAIPAAAFYTWLQRTVDVVAQRMEDAATRVFTVSLFGQADGATKAPAEDDET